MAKEKGLSKSALITIALGEYKKGQNGHKKERLGKRYAQSTTHFCKVNISLWLKIKQDTSLFVIP